MLLPFTLRPVPDNESVLPCRSIQRQHCSPEHQSRQLHAAGASAHAGARCLASNTCSCPRASVREFQRTEQPAMVTRWPADCRGYMFSLPECSSLSVWDCRGLPTVRSAPWTVDGVRPCPCPHLRRRSSSADVPDNVSESHTAPRPFPGPRHVSRPDVPDNRPLSGRFAEGRRATDRTAAISAWSAGGAGCGDARSWPGGMPSAVRSRERGQGWPGGRAAEHLGGAVHSFVERLRWRLRHANTLLLLPGLLCLAAAIVGQALNLSR